jgi:hypothetical protein
VTARSLQLEPLETRTLLSVTVNSLTWKTFDFTANGAMTGYVSGGVIPAPYKANLSGPVNVQQGHLVYDLDPAVPGTTKGVGDALVSGTITAAIRGYGQIKQVQVENGGETSSVIDANGAISIAVPGQTNAAGQPMVLTGSFNTQNFRVAASTSIRLEINQGVNEPPDPTSNDPTGIATWIGTIVPTPTATPFAVDIVDSAAKADFYNRTLDLEVKIDGPVQKALTRTSAVASVKMQWLGIAGKKLTKLPDQIPLVWNQASGKYRIDLPTPPSAATHLQITATKGRLVLDTLLLELPPKPVLSIDSVTIEPPAIGTVDAVFKVTLTGQALAPVTVKYTTANGTARSVEDYTRVAGTLTFPLGTSDQMIVVKVKRDSVVRDEQFTVRLSAPTYAVLSPALGQGIGTIHDVAPLSAAAVDQILGAA